ncbi:MAG: hypothetical protein IJV66_04550, partial [Firmicutes bacterium]|nr:hypothetical protein [Bacillota bacterium]
IRWIGCKTSRFSDFAPCVKGVSYPASFHNTMVLNKFAGSVENPCHPAILCLRIRWIGCKTSRFSDFAPCVKGVSYPASFHNTMMLNNS